MLKDDISHIVYHNGEEIALYISNTFDVYFNFTHMTGEWKIGNLKKTRPEGMVRKVMEEDTDALNAARSVTVKELVERYGNRYSKKVFFMGDYKSYLLNCHLETLKISVDERRRDQ